MKGRRGVGRNRTKGIDLYVRGCDGHYNGCLKAARYFQKSQSTLKSARKYYHEACIRTSAAGCYGVGRMAEAGAGGEQDLRRAGLAYKLACDRWKRASHKMAEQACAAAERIGKKP